MRQLNMHLVFAVATVVVLIAKPLSGQSVCDSTRVVLEISLTGVGSDYARLAELADSARATPRLARRLSNPATRRCISGPWNEQFGNREFNSALLAVPLSATTTFNSSYPEDRNNGAQWSGRGMTLALEGGGIFRVGPLTLAALPVVTYQQNRAYELLPPVSSGLSVYSNGLYATVDAPQRFGPQDYSTIGWGQSSARIDLWKLGVGFSNENLWWGPGASVAILLTNTAPGFPHGFLNTRRPLNIRIGKLSAEAIWGKLSESNYFDTIPDNDKRLIVGGMLTFEPAPIPGFYVGLGRTFVVPWDSISARNLFPLGQTFWKKGLATSENPSGASNDDQRVSIMGRYVLQESHFEVYGEWAREDHSWDKSDFIQEPEHAAAHVIGAQKLFMPSSQRWVRVYAEAANLQTLRRSRAGIRSTPSFYTHRPQGHTHRGQLLGASIGPGGESQLLGIDVWSTSGLVGGYVERVRRDEFSARGIAAWSTAWPPRHDVAVTTGFRVSRRIWNLRMDANFARSKRYNRNFIRDEFNSRLDLGITWLRGPIQNPSLSTAATSVVSELTAQNRID